MYSIGHEFVLQNPFFWTHCPVSIQISVGDGDLVSGGDGDLVSDRDGDLVSDRDGDLVSDRDDDLVSDENDEVLGHSIIPQSVKSPW